MTNNELVATVSKMIHDSLLDHVTTRELAKEILDKVEPMIRADERKCVADRVRIPHDVATDSPDPWVPLADMIALIEQGPR